MRKGVLNLCFGFWYLSVEVIQFFYIIRNDLRKEIELVSKGVGSIQREYLSKFEVQ